MRGGGVGLFRWFGGWRLWLVPAGAEQDPVVADHPGVFLLALARLWVLQDVVNPAALLGRREQIGTVEGRSRTRRLGSGQ